MNRTKAGGTTQQQWQFHQSLQADRNKTFLCPLWTGKMWEPRLEYFSTNSNLNDSFTFVAHFKNSCTIVTLSYLIQLFQIDAGVRRSSPKWPEPERIFQCFENIQPVVPQFFSVKPRWRELSDSHEKDKFLVMSKSWHFLLQPLITVWAASERPLLSHLALLASLSDRQCTIKYYSKITQLICLAVYILLLLFWVLALLINHSIWKHHPRLL